MLKLYATWVEICSFNKHQQDREWTYNKIEERSRNHCWRGKAISIKYLCVCVRRARVRACSLAYPAHNAYAPYCDVICDPLRLHHLFRHYLINGTIFEKEKVMEYKMCFDFLHNLCLKHFSF